MIGMPAPDVQAIAAAVEQARARQAEQATESAAPSEALHQPVPPAAEPTPAAEPSSLTEPTSSAESSSAAEPPPPAEPPPSIESTPSSEPTPPAGHAFPENLAHSPMSAAEAPTVPNLTTPRAEEPKRRAVAPSNRTMLGQPVPQIALAPPNAAESEPAARSRARAMYPSEPTEAEPIVLPKKGRGLAIALFLVGVLALLGAGGAIVTMFASGSDLRASVVQGDDGELLEIEVPGAPAGTRLRFRGQEQPLEAGRARFPLSADALSLGDNELTVDVIAPDGSIASEKIALHLEMRVRTDLGPLERIPPAIDVVVEVPPGSDVTLDGELLELDDKGRATRRFPIEGAEANAEGIVEHVVRYRVVPPEGDTAQGELRTRIPLTTMQLDRPGRQVVTEAEEVEVAGAVAPGSTVTVAGEEVPVNLGRFLTTHPLPTVGEHTIEVVARAPGKAPRIERITVRRVADLAAEAARFEVNRQLTYARIAQDPNTYSGQNIALEGTVYNVDVSGGRSVLQILVSDCPEGASCSLWVTYPAATDAELQDRVRVLGTVAGEQQFRTQRGEVRTVPRVDATFVLPVTGRR